MDFKLFNAILSMDSYSRGYDPAIKFGNLANGESLTLGEQIGVATITTDSRSLENPDGTNQDNDIGFYALAYDIGGAGKIISYRGTDDFDSAADLLTSKDVANGWWLGGGDYNVLQAWMAVEFYNEVAGSAHPILASISTTGHSLGGGLASFIGCANDNFYYSERIAA